MRVLTAAPPVQLRLELSGNPAAHGLATARELRNLGCSQWRSARTLERFDLVAHGVVDTPHGMLRAERELMGDTLASRLAHLHHVPHLRLSLPCAGLGPRSGRFLAVLLGPDGPRESLRLELGGNFLGTLGVSYLLQHSERLRCRRVSLSLRANGIGDDAMEITGSHLLSGRATQSVCLDLSHNGLSGEGLQRLLVACARSPVPELSVVLSRNALLAVEDAQTILLTAQGQLSSGRSAGSYVTVTV